MSDKVVSIGGGEVLQKEPNEVCVEALEVALEKAKSGEVVGVVIGQVYHDELTDYMIAGLVGGHGVIGAIERAKMRLLSYFEDE